MRRSMHGAVRRWWWPWVQVCRTCREPYPCPMIRERLGTDDASAIRAALDQYDAGLAAARAWQVEQRARWAAMRRGGAE